MDGLDTVVIDQDGSLVLHRRKWETDSGAGWETASAQLPRESVAGIRKAIEANDLLGLAKAYHADVFDGTQWVLWIRQGSHEKAVYFNNHFPDSILRFADRLDEIVARSAGPNLRWQAVRAFELGEHQRGLWDSIRR